MAETTRLRCMQCGRETGLLAERKFECPCGGLYDVVHGDARPIRELMCVFDQRVAERGRNSFDPRNHSGVWRFKEWIMPDLPDRFIVSLGEGNVPIVPAGANLLRWIGGDIDLWLILEGMNPTGSFKDMGGTVMVSAAKWAGINALGCASTGDTSAMASAYAAAAGMDCAVILPKGKVTPVQLAQPLVHGAKVLTIPGDFDDCMRIVRELVEAGRLFPANSLNPARIEGHQATVFLTAQYFHWSLPDWFAVPVGNGSNCSSVGKALRFLNRPGGITEECRILGCQSRAAMPLAVSWGSGMTVEEWRSLYQPMRAGKTSASAAAIGNPVSREKVMREIIASNGAMAIAEETALNEAVAVCGRDGYFVCPQTGIALEGVRQAVQNGYINRYDRVVVVSTANGLKFTESAAENLLGTVIDLSDCSAERAADALGL